MRIVSISEVSGESFVHPEFTGPNVTKRILPHDDREFSVNVVNSGNGARNRFHAHDAEQILIVTTGKGIVATEKEERVVSEGDVVIIPAGVKHWHAATPHAEFSHIFVPLRDGDPTRRGD